MIDHILNTEHSTIIDAMPAWLAAGKVGMPPGGALAAEGADTVAYVNNNTRLEPRLQMLADIERLQSVAQMLLNDLRKVAREHDLRMRGCALELAILEVEKMLSAAMENLTAGLVQGSIGMASAVVQISSAASALKDLKASVKKLEPESNALEAAKTRLEKAELEVSKLDSEGVTADDSSMVSARNELDAAKTSYKDAKDNYLNQRSILGIDEQTRAIEIRTRMLDGVSAGVRSIGEIAAGVFKYNAAVAEAEKAWIDAIKQYVQSAQRINQDFERDAAEWLRQEQDFKKTHIDRAYQASLNQIRNMA